MLVVPALGKCLDVEERRAHASAIAVMLPISALSAFSMTIRGVWDVWIGVSVACGATVGGALGATMLKKANKEILSVLFYGIMIYAGIKYLI